MLRAPVLPELPANPTPTVDGFPEAEKNPAMKSKNPENKQRLSLDWWTVLVGLALAALVIAGLPAIPW